MHSSKFLALSRAADEASQVVVSVVEDVAANAETDVILGAVILQGERVVVLEKDGDEIKKSEVRPVWSFARFAISQDDEVVIEGEQVTYGNLSKAFKFLSDYTLDRRPMVFLEDGTEVMSQDGEKSAA